MVNTHLEQQQGQLAHTSQLRDIVDSFPDGIVHSFGYGSGVFAQQQLSQNPSEQHNETNKEESEQPMVDLIFVVKDAKQWHEDNLQQNPHHYAWLCSTRGSTFCSNLQRHYGASVFFHAFIPLVGQNRLLKYGVVQKEDLLQDLQQWKYLYLAGRLHKPTVTIRQDDQIMESQQDSNLPSALAASLLLQEDVHPPPPTTTATTTTNTTIPVEELYLKIANLSYAGDIRMQTGAEDPEKVRKLVHSPGQLERFHALYNDPLQKLHQQGLIHVSHHTTTPRDTTTTTTAAAAAVVEWDSSCPQARQALWEQCLPSSLQPSQSSSSLLDSYTNTNNLATLLANIVAPAARSQSMKGLVTAGVTKSIRYAGAKFAKGAFRKIVK